MKSAGKARSNGLYRHIRTSKEIIRNLLNYYREKLVYRYQHQITRLAQLPVPSLHVQKASPQLSQIRIPSGMAVTIQSAVHQ